MLLFPSHLLVVGFGVQAPLHRLHPQLLLGRVQIEEGLSAQVQLLKTTGNSTSNGQYLPHLYSENISQINAESIALALALGSFDMVKMVEEEEPTDPRA